MRRWDDIHQTVMRYRAPSGFFVKVNHDAEQNEVTFVFAFIAVSKDDRLEYYSMSVKLPDWMPEAE